MARLAFTHSFQAVRPFLRRLSSFSHHTDQASVDNHLDSRGNRKRTRSVSRSHRKSRDSGSETTFDTSHLASPTAASKLRTECSDDFVSSTASTIVSGHDDSPASVSPSPPYVKPASAEQADLHPHVASIARDDQPEPTKDSDQLLTTGDRAEGNDAANAIADAIKTCPTLVVQQASPDFQTQTTESSSFAISDHQRSRASSQTLQPLPTPPPPADNLVSQLENCTSASSTSHAPGPDVHSDDPLRVTNLDAVDGTRPDCLSHANTTSVASDAAQFLQSDAPVMAQPIMRKIWVKRPSQSATLVHIREDDLVDDVRDMILKKYANSLGRTFDSPDMTLRILMRPNPAGLRVEHILGPEEEMIRVIESYFPDGQKVADALVIDVPQKRTPRPSPRGLPAQHYYSMDDYRPMENGNDYFPPMAEAGPSNILLGPVPGRDQHNGDHGPRSISVITTGHIAPIPSPGTGNRRLVSHRPKYARQHTSSPGIVQHTINGASANPNVPPLPTQHRTLTRGRADSSASEANRSMTVNAGPPAPPLPSPPAPLVPSNIQNISHPPTPSGGAHRNTKPRRVRRATPEKAVMRRSTPGADGYAADPMMPGIASMLDNPAPPINVLIVEDNSVNLKIMEGLMKRLKVRWQTAVNGKIAVDKWRAGGFHLVVMDIQMPIMNGLQATKEIRRLERVNGIGVFSSSAPSSPTENSASEPNGKGKEVTREPHNPEDDELPAGEGLFKSPVIIVALTASALQSDRHQALAAGCNDFLTKPVSFHWLERKIKEWGCMQALIDFDGWRKWRDVAAREAEGKTEAEKAKDKEVEAKQRKQAEKWALLAEKREKAAAEKADAAATTNGASSTAGPVAVAAE